MSELDLRSPDLMRVCFPLLQSVPSCEFILAYVSISLHAADFLGVLLFQLPSYPGTVLSFIIITLRGVWPVGVGWVGGWEESCAIYPELCCPLLATADVYFSPFRSGSRQPLNEMCYL